MHRLLTPFLLIAALFHGPSYTKVIDKAQSSVVRISGTVQSEEGVGEYTCTGFVIATHRVLTAAHCVYPSMMSDGDKVVVLKVDKYYDLALLDVDTKKAPLSMRDAKPVRFERLTGIGYGYGWTRLVVLDVRVFLVDISPEDGLAPGIWVQNGWIGGMSGGPVVDVNGKVVGIVQRADTHVGYGVGVQLIKAFLLGT